MENADEEQQKATSIKSIVVESSHKSIDETNNAQKLPISISLIQSLLFDSTELNNDKDKTEKTKIKSLREKELERLTKATNIILTSPGQLNSIGERLSSCLLGRKTVLLTACHSLDKFHSGRLPYEQFRLILRDHLSELTAEDVFILTKLFGNDESIDYQTIFDENHNNGILRYITLLPIPKAKSIVFEKNISHESQQSFNDESIQSSPSRYVTLHLRFIPFDFLNTYQGHVNITIQDHISIYALSKMIIDKTDLATRSVSIFREKNPSRHALLDPMRSLESSAYVGAYVDGTHNQAFPSYILYYDYSPTVHTYGNCPILSCDYYMK